MHDEPECNSRRTSIVAGEGYCRCSLLAALPLQIHSLPTTTCTAAAGCSGHKSVDLGSAHLESGGDAGGVVKRVPPDEHEEQDDAAGPHVCRLAVVLVLLVPAGVQKCYRITRAQICPCRRAPCVLVPSAATKSSSGIPIFLRICCNEHYCIDQVCC